MQDGWPRAFRLILTYNARFFTSRPPLLDLHSAMLQSYEKPSQASEFLTKGQEHWLSVSSVLLQLNAILPREDRSGFITLADLHAGAWFARILACVGATELPDVEGAFEKLTSAFGRTVEEVMALKNWWTSMVTRESFKEIYGSGLH